MSIPKYRPCCVACGRVMRVEAIGFYTLEMAPGADNEPEPYQLYATDLYQCPRCSAQVTVVTHNNPLIARHEKAFAETADANLHVEVLA